MEFKEIISVIADTITIIGLIWATLFGILNKHKSLIGFRINEFIISMFKLSIIAFIGTIIFHLSSLLYNFMLVLTKGESHGELWEESHEFEHLLSYFISGAIGVTLLWLLSTIVWTGSLVYCRNIWYKSKIKKMIESTVEDNKLVILKAEYKTANKSYDVTEKLKKMISKNKLTITASNQLAGDPEYGVIKILEIQYRFGDASIEIIRIPENETRTIEQE